MFYADNGMVASSDPIRLQGAFNALVGLFYRVGLYTNAGKGIIFHLDKILYLLYAGRKYLKW